MRNICLAWLLLFPIWGGEVGVTYTLSGGRFGDCLLSYLHAKWISYQRNIPLFYVPFPFSEELVLSEEKPLKGQKEVKVKWGDSGPSKSSYIWVCPYFPETKWERLHTKNEKNRPWKVFDVDWKDGEFRKLVKRSIAPKKPLVLIEPPAGKVSIALHIREGGGFDGEDIKKLHPLKFPPLEYYVNCLLSVIEKYRGESFYCYLFTDAVNPNDLVEKIKESLLPTTPIIFDYRMEGNQHNANVLQDFFSLFNFRILIRPQSNFSLIPTLIHDYDSVFSPEEP
jgi:hypothetical protein